MDKITVKEILNAAKGKVFSLKEDTAIKGVSIDSRTIKKGDMFIALKGEHSNGHNFVDDAFKKGAKAALVSRNVGANKPACASHADRPVIKVKDTLKALGDISAYYRSRFKVKVIGVTGSNGKTTTKNMIAHILSRSFKVISSYASFNNFIGVPLTLLRINKETDILIQEMETNVLGGIERLSDIANPSVGVVTNIGSTHLESLKTEYNVFREKSELIKHLPRNGVSVINRDDKFFTELKRISKGRVITFGTKKGADLRASEVKLAGERVYFDIGKVGFTLSTLFYKNIYNALAAIAVAREAFGISLKQSSLALRNFKFPLLRSQLIKTKRALIINDCFNANPQSVKDALLMLASVKGRYKIAVLGDMLELGLSSEKFHYEIGEACSRLKLDMLIAYGKMARFIVKGAKDSGMGKIVYCKKYDDVVQSLIDNIEPFSTVLVKGSRAMRMENIVKELLRKLRR